MHGSNWAGRHDRCQKRQEEEEEEELHRVKGSVTDAVLVEREVGVGSVVVVGRRWTVIAVKPTRLLVLTLRHRVWSCLADQDAQSTRSLQLMPLK